MRISLRRKHGFTEPADGSDAVVKAIMNPGDSAVGWKKVAGYLLDVFNRRDVILDTVLRLNISAF
jgi:hypothetical protein